MISIERTKNFFAKIAFRSTILTVLSVLCAYAQSQFEITIQQFNGNEVKGYIQPLGDMFGANMNAGLYHSAAMARDGFHIRIEVLGMVSLVRDEHRVYDATLPAGFAPDGGSFKTATVFGGKGTTFKDLNSGLEYKGSDGIFSTNIFPLVVPQATIGTILGTEATVRYITTPPLSGGRLPSSMLWGIGVRHNLSQYFGNASPVDASLGAFYSNFSIGDLLNFDGRAIDLQISKTVLLFTLYGGVAMERSVMNLHYTYKASELASAALVNLQLEGSNKFRVTTGIQIDLQAIRLYADANFGHVQHYSGGIGFGF